MILSSFSYHSENFQALRCSFAQSSPLFHSLSCWKDFSYWKGLQGFSLWDLCGLDEPSQSLRFRVLACLWKGLPDREKLLVQRTTAYSLCSWSPSFSSALWLEREIFDLLGIFFEHHEDLRRILTDYGFPSYPLRKDFPLTGHFELSFSPTTRAIQSWTLRLPQSLRNLSL